MYRIVILLIFAFLTSHHHHHPLYLLHLFQHFRHQPIQKKKINFDEFMSHVEYYLLSKNRLKWLPIWVLVVSDLDAFVDSEEILSMDLKPKITHCKRCMQSMLLHDMHWSESMQLSDSNMWVHIPLKGIYLFLEMSIPLVGNLNTLPISLVHQTYHSCYWSEQTENSLST